MEGSRQNGDVEKDSTVKSRILQVPMQRPGQRTGPDEANELLEKTTLPVFSSP